MFQPAFTVITRSVTIYWRKEVTVVVLQVSYVAYLRL
jgi:hypothetical protein